MGIYLWGGVAGTLSCLKLGVRLHTSTGGSIFRAHVGAPPRSYMQISGPHQSAEASCGPGSHHRFG